MNLSEITALRLRNQQIVSGDLVNPAKTPGALVARMGAFQAQDYAGAKWSLGLRLFGATEADIDTAIAERTIVRTWPMRGTLHFVPGPDVRWMLELTTPRIIAGSAARHGQLELDDKTFARSRQIITDALTGGKILRRDALLQTLEDAGISTANGRGYHLLWRNAQEGLISFASYDDKQPTFALLDDWIAPDNQRRFADRTEALGELARRYFTSHGPATLQDFAWWTYLLAADAKAGLEAAKSHLESAEVEGKTYWMPPGLRDAALEPTVFLLPGFDEYLLGYKDRSAALPSAHAQKIVPGNNGMFLPTIVSDGQVIGTWKRVITKRGVTVTPQPFETLTKAQETGIARAAEQYHAYLGLAKKQITRAKHAGQSR